MAISANVVWEIRSSATASNVNGGGFVTGASGTDYSQQDAAQYALTDATSAGADAVILHEDAAADMIGNIARVVSGTNATAGWYEITDVDPGVSITLDRNWGSGAVASGVVNIGGALSLGHSSDNTFFNGSGPIPAGATVYIKYGSYTFGAAMGSAGVNGSITAPIKFIGYNTTRGDNPTTTDERPTIAMGGNGPFLPGQNWVVRNINFTSTGAAHTLTLAALATVIECGVVNSNATNVIGINVAAGGSFIYRCDVKAVGGRGIACIANCLVSNCYVYDCGTAGIQCQNTTSESVIRECIVKGCVTAVAIALAPTTGGVYLIGNTLYGAETPTGTGVSMVTASNTVRLLNNIIYGFVDGVTHADSGFAKGFDEGNVYYNNTTNSTNWTLGSSSKTDRNPRFKNPSAVDFTPGTFLRGIGQPQSFADGQADNFSDVGAIQQRWRGQRFRPQ